MHRTQSLKDRLSTIPLTKVPSVGESMETENQMVALLEGLQLQFGMSGKVCGHTGCQLLHAVSVPYPKHYKDNGKNG